jgi:hypothetical protein
VEGKKERTKHPQITASLWLAPGALQLAAVPRQSWAGSSSEQACIEGKNKKG